MACAPFDARSSWRRSGRISRLQPRQGRRILDFHGPPGTGKTRAARGVTRRLGQPLYKVDYSAVISKYLGDTAKHIKLAFEHATHHGAFLFFDKADRLLSMQVSLDESCATSINQNRNTLTHELDRCGGVVVITRNLFSNKIHPSALKLFEATCGTQIILLAIPGGEQTRRRRCHRPAKV